MIKNSNHIVQNILNRQTMLSDKYVVFILRFLQYKCKSFTSEDPNRKWIFFGTKSVMHDGKQKKERR